MADLEKVIKVYECCRNSWRRNCDDCPIKKDCCHDGLPEFAIWYALELLKSQQEQIEILKITQDKIADFLTQPEIVRCKDCKYWKRRECGSYGTCENENMNMCGFFDSEWYCADGEKLDEE